MALDRSLWVDDRYAARCRDCGARFNLLRRRHHCRHCGQVFCGDCLVSSPPARLGDVFVDVVSSLAGVRRGALVKLCHECDRILRRRGVWGRGGHWGLLPPARALTAHDPQTGNTSAGAAHEEEGKKEKEGMHTDVAVAPPPAASVATNFTASNTPAGVGEADGDENVTVCTSHRLHGEKRLLSSSNTPASVHCQPPALLLHARLPTHPESLEDREISYGLTDVPVYSRNSIADWMHKLLKETKKNLPHNSREEVRSSSLMMQTSSYTPYPKAYFRIEDAREDKRWHMNEFSSSASKQMLQKLEEECSYHLIKRVSRRFMKEKALSLKDETGMDPIQWIAGICDISWRLVSQLYIVTHEHMEQHLDVICIPGGQFADTEIITGVAFLQNIAFKRMKTYIKSPRILLLSGNVGTEVNPKMDFLEYVENSKGYLDKQYQRILIWKPTVIVVEGNMHHYFQDKILCESQATLILHAGEVVLQRLSRCCKAKIISDLQYVGTADLHDTSIIGTCESFQLVHHGDRPVCVFKTPQVPLFSTVILRGVSGNQMSFVKPLLFNAARTAYHLSLQVHSLFDLGIKISDEFLAAPENERVTQIHHHHDDGDNNNNNNNNNNKMKEENIPPLWGKASKCEGFVQYEEYMKFISSSPRKEDRLETLSMNMGVSFPPEVEEVNEKYDDMMMDSIIVNTVFIDSVSGGLTGEETGGKLLASNMTSSYSVRQFREVLPFYSEGDETLLDFLTGRAKEGDSLRLIVHGNKRLSVKTTTNFCNTTHIRRTVFKQNGSSFLHPSAQPFFANSQSTGNSYENNQTQQPIRGSAACKQCFNSMGSDLANSQMKPCSLHTLNLSWGAFLEFLFYSSSCFTSSCGHKLGQGLGIVFIVFPNTGGEVTVSITVEQLTIYDIIIPPATMPSCAEAVKLHLRNEMEEMERCILSVSAAIQAMMAMQRQQQHHVPSTQPQISPGARTPKPTFSLLLNARGSAMGEDHPAEIVDEKGKELLQRAEELLKLLQTIKTLEELTILRLNELANIMVDFFEWYKHGMAGVERRNGKPPALVSAASFEDHYWTYCPRSNCGIRLNEPSSIVAQALQALSLSSCNPHESSSGVTRMDVAHVPETTAEKNVLSDLGDDNNNNNSDTDTSDSETDMKEHTQVLLENSMEVVLGIEPSLSPDTPPSSLYIRSTWDALDILSCRNRSAKTTFRHVTEVIFPWDRAGMAIVTVEMMFPEQFTALQYLYTEGRIDNMLFSLSRSRAFKSEGGKTKTDFFITLDERFLMKQIKQAELKHFAEFGPNYFSHMYRMYSNLGNNNQTNDNNDKGMNSLRGSVLAKIFGVFSIHIQRSKRCSETPAEIRYYVLMENVFFSSHVDVTYDLKGSQRNRTAVEGSSVLLDQDLVSTLQRGAFFYCDNDVKSVLMDSLMCDAHLLSTSSIMDYSMVAALDEEGRRLHLGVVDYLHPYTGVKVIESKVKAGLDTVLGHAGRDPTIIDPVNYRNRFARWLDGCFCGVPDKIFATRRAKAKENPGEKIKLT